MTTEHDSVRQAERVIFLRISNLFNTDKEVYNWYFSPHSFLDPVMSFESRKPRSPAQLLRAGEAEKVLSFIEDILLNK